MVEAAAAAEVRMHPVQWTTRDVGKPVAMWGTSADALRHTVNAKSKTYSKASGAAGIPAAVSGRVHVFTLWCLGPPESCSALNPPFR